MLNIKRITSKLSDAAILCAIIGAALYFRVGIGLNWDEGHGLHPDERFLMMVTEGIRLPSGISEYFNSSTSALSPYNNDYGFFVYGTLPIFLTKVVHHLLQPSPEASVYRVGRVISSLFDVLTILLVYLIGRRIYSRGVGLLSAAFLAFSVLNIQLSHFYGVENVMAFFVTLTFYVCLGFHCDNFSAQAMPLITGSGWRWAGSLFLNRKTLIQAVLCGFTFGCALASKISALFFLPIIGIFLFVKLVRHALEMKRSGALSLRALYSLVESFCFIFIIILIVTALTFRCFQPYAFAGDSVFNFQFADKFIANMKEIKHLMGDTSAGFPPSVQWVDRAPILFVLSNMFFWNMGVFFCVVAWSAVLWCIYELIARGKLSHIYWIAWILIWFLYQGTRFVMAGRYFSGIYPFLALAAGYYSVTLSCGILADDKEGGQAVGKRRIAGFIPAGLALSGTLAWAVAFTNIYRVPHSRISSSRWIYENIPCGAVLANEHWDDGMPMRIEGKDGFGGCYRGIEFNHYWVDDQKKLNDTLSKLSQAQYIILSSNRLYLSIPRIPKRFPFTIRYYQMLFSGELGFDLVESFSSYPNLFGIEFNDDYSEEPFTVYDHPKVLVFKKNSNFDLAKVSGELRRMGSGVF